MNLIRIPLLLGLCATWLVAAEDPFEEVFKGETLRPKLEKVQKALEGITKMKGAKLSTVDGKPIEWSQITMVDPHGIKVMHSGGVKKIELASLDQNSQRAFGFDQAKAASFQKREQDEAAYVAGEMESKNRQAKLKETISVRARQAKEGLEKSKRFAVIRVHFSNEEGVAGFPKFALPDYTPKYSTLGSFRGYERDWLLEEEEQRDAIWVYGKFNVADGEQYTVKLYNAGTYSYNSVGAGRKTLRAYATSAEDALAILLEQELAKDSVVSER